LLFTSNGEINTTYFFKVDKVLQAIPLSETVNFSFAMLDDPSLEVARHPDVEGASPEIGHNVNIARLHIA
jgi:hypothetical protein